MSRNRVWFINCRDRGIAWLMSGSRTRVMARVLGLGAGVVGVGAVAAAYLLDDDQHTKRQFARVAAAESLKARPNRSLLTREQQLKNLGSESFDVLVIGGGATGAGCALDAVSRGLKTALVEMDDFSSGTSSRLVLVLPFFDGLFRQDMVGSYLNEGSYLEVLALISKK
ncbi:glycerol-3-phosphate dehydrogenase, mitochondrial-like [Penaeus vannamei]|uniref:glycerol-3-phosphate dehydrogenase, mitochondrial-like n=1 Tax=Penaeus vannamei TaxID=6689 RepID=UPI00387FA398